MHVTLGTKIGPVFITAIIVLSALSALNDAVLPTSGRHARSDIILISSDSLESYTHFDSVTMVTDRFVALDSLKSRPAR